MIFYFFAGIIGIIIDFITKKLAVGYLKDGADKILIDGVFKLSYVENRGAAFGILSNHRALFIALTVFIVLLILIMLIKLKPKSRLLRWGATLIISGAAGNLADRIMLGYVVDFLDFYLIGFPVFNFADCFVCVGAFASLLYYLFFDGKKADGEVSDNE